MQTLHKILRCHTCYKDVFREVGLLEVFVTCLHRYAALLKEPVEGGEGVVAGTEQEMGSLTMEVLTQLLNSNNSNAGLCMEQFIIPMAGYPYFCLCLQRCSVSVGEHDVRTTWCRTPHAGSKLWELCSNWCSPLVVMMTWARC